MPRVGLRAEHDDVVTPLQPPEPAPPADVEVADESDTGQRRWAVVAVVVVALVGAALRLVMTNAYLPYSHNLDEVRNIQEAEEMFDEATVEQVGYNYPSLLYDVQLAVLGAMSFTSSEDEPVVDVQGPGTAVADDADRLRLLRLFTGLVPGVGTVVLAGAIAWVISRRWWPTALAATLAALSPIDLLYGNYVSPDALSGTACTAAVLGATLVALRPTTRRYVITGALVGIAAGAKYNCVLAIVPLVVAHFVGNPEPRRDWRKVAYACFTTLGVFVVTTPSALIAPIELTVGFGAVYRNYSLRGQFSGLGNSPAVQLRWLWYGFGPALILLPLCFLARRSARTVALVPLSFTLLYPAVLATPKTGYARNLLPVTGSLAAVAALGAYAIAQALQVRFPTRVRLAPAMAALLSVGLLVLPAVNASAALDAVKDDPWSETQAWMRENLPPGTVVAIEPWAPVVDEDRFKVVPTFSLGGRPLAVYGMTGVDVVVTTSARSQPYLRRPDEHPDATAVYEAILHPDCRLFKATGDLDPVGGTDRPEGVEIVVASVDECTELQAERDSD